MTGNPKNMKKKQMCSLLLFLFLPIASAFANCAKPILFFDLGQTLVDTDTNKYNPMFYLKVDPKVFTDGNRFSDAKKYIDALVEAKFDLGLMIDIPGDWGVNYPLQEPIKNLPTAKLIRTMDFIAGIIPEDESGWTGEPFDWKPFVQIHGKGAERIFKGTFLASQTDTERKGKGSLVLFERAKKIADAQGCAAIYQGENEKEMILAEKAGMIPFWVGHTISGSFFLAPEKAVEYARDFQPGSWKNH